MSFVESKQCAHRAPMTRDSRGWKLEKWNVACGGKSQKVYSRLPGSGELKEREKAHRIFHPGCRNFINAQL